MVCKLCNINHKTSIVVVEKSIYLSGILIFFPDMAAQLFNRIGQVGLGVALVGGVVNSALYNGIV